MKKGLLKGTISFFKGYFIKKTLLDRQLERLQESIVKDYDPKVFALNAFFTALVDYEHSGKDLKLKNLYRSVDTAVLYFGSTSEGVIQNLGIQTKTLYPLIEFIDSNNLWATITKTKRFHLRNKYVSDMSFNNVVSALNANPDPELVKLFNMYPYNFFEIAYTAVAEIGHENLLGLQPWNAGQLAIKIIRKARGIKEPHKNILIRTINIMFKLIYKAVKYLIKFTVVLCVLYFIYWYLISGNAM